MRNITLLSTATALIIFSSCKKQERSLDDITIFFEYYKCINIDFKNKTIEAYYRDLSYKDTILFTQKDSVELIHAISNNKIDILKGEYSYPKCSWLMPSFEDKIQIFKNNKALGSIEINYEPSCSDNKEPEELEKRNRAFGIEIRNLIFKKPSFKRAMDTLQAFRQKRKGIL